MKSLFEKLGGAYHQAGDYFLPICLCLKPLLLVSGAQQKHSGALYNALLLGGKLDDHLTDVAPR